MTEWFHERYISRAEHEEVVAYYGKLVAQLYRQLKDLRTAGIDTQAIDSISMHGKHKAEREMRRAAEASPGPDFQQEFGGNVIVVDFRKREIDLPH